MSSLERARKRQTPKVEPDEVGPVETRRVATPQMMGWLELRHALGKTRDRRKWLQFMTAVTSYRPWPWQVRFHLGGVCPEDVRPNKLAVCGVGSGKTTASGLESVELHTVNPGCDHVMVAPTYDQCREVLLPHWLQRCEEMAEQGYPLLRKPNWSILRFDLHCGGRVFFRSADKVANLRGFQFATLTGDEWDYMRGPMDVWDTLSGRLRFQPAHQRQAVITTTPYAYTNSIIEHFALQRQAAQQIADPAARAIALQQWWFCRAPTTANLSLTRDYLDSLLSYSKTQYIREVLAYPTVHRAARVYETYGEQHITDRGFDRSKPYDVAIDWGFHKPAFVFIQSHGAMAVVFWEWMPEGLNTDKQLDGLRKLFDLFGRPPEHAVVDRADSDAIRAFRRRFRGVTVRSAVTRAEQSRESTVDSLQRLLDPWSGEPKLFITRNLTSREASERGVHRALQGLEWEYDRVNARYLDDAKKDGFYEHAAEALGYWAKLIGVDRAKAFSRQIVYGRQDDLADKLGLLGR